MYKCGFSVFVLLDFLLYLPNILFFSTPNSNTGYQNYQHYQRKNLEFSLFRGRLLRRTNICSDTMKTTQIAQYALRLTYSQPVCREKLMSRSAFALAAIGLGLSTYSVRQMVLTQPRRI